MALGNQGKKKKQKKKTNKKTRWTMTDLESDGSSGQDTDNSSQVPAFWNRLRKES